MSEYSPEEFIKAFRKRTNTKQIQCPYCGGNNFTSTTDLATILVSKDKSKLSLEFHIPSGMIICENCGHIDFFALGVLGLMEKSKKDDVKDADSK